MKKVKFEAIIKISDDTIIEESMVKRTAGLLGEIESFNVTHDLNSEFKKKDHLENSNGSSDPFSQISKTINNANKIYYGSLSLDERKAVSLTIFIQSNFDKIKSDQEFQNKLLNIFEKKFLFEHSLSKKIIEESGENSQFDSFKKQVFRG